ncbi:MAG: ABC transporter ATP-binding protein [Candidatus Omnitrophica bacterium]|nr:ABC transporter ATP-binding protein [Candidatus Omnitrophota bacterium]
MGILEVKDLFCGYEKVPVIKGVSFSVNKGEFIGIIGPNGAGKTTFFRAISGLLRPAGGGIEYKGKDVLKIPPKEFASEIAVIPQMLDVPFDFTVGEFVMMGRFSLRGRFESLKEEDHKALKEILEMTDMTSLKERRISELSGGERQRAVLAQGFAQEPELLIMDEPTAALDIGHKVRIMDLVKRLKKKRALTVLAAFHDLNLASVYSDKLILLKEGKVFTTGTPGDVLTYQNVEEVYKTLVVVKEDPVSAKPCVFLVSAEDEKKSPQPPFSKGETL